MADTTAIEWADATFNPWHGCEKVSPACAHCYAERDSKRYGFTIWGAGHEFRFLSEDNWAKPLRWARLAREGKLPNGKENPDGHRPRIFCASMADVFEERPELYEHRDRLFAMIEEETPELDWLVLTKRPEAAADFFRDFYWGDYVVLPNLWLGVSIENARFTWRADVLREIPAAVRFISAEPLLGSLFEDHRAPNTYFFDGQRIEGARSNGRAPLDLTGIDWVIAGGESGAKARPSHPDWFRELRDACAEQTPCYICLDESNDLVHRWGMCQCTCHGTRPAFFFKQWGNWAPGRIRGVRVVEIDGTPMSTLGRKWRHRELDGRTWNEFPASAAVAA